MPRSRRPGLAFDQCPGQRYHGAHPPPIANTPTTKPLEERFPAIELDSREQALLEIAKVLPWFPCRECCRAISQAGIKRVIAQYPDISDPTWGPGFVDWLDILERGNVVFTPYVAQAPKTRADGDHATVEVREWPTAHELMEAWNAKVEQQMAARRKPATG